MSNLVEEMLASTSKDVAVFQKFILDYNNYNNTLFYFVEGKDFCYYNPRIQKYINNFEITHYKCGGKKHVIGVYELIKNNIKYNNGNKMLYFVDKDYGFNNELISNEIYVTDLYSIENFYLNKDTIKRILTEFMEIDIHTQNYKMAMFYFEKCYDEYSIFGKNINAFLYTVRFYEKERKLKRTDFNIKFSKFLLNKSLPCYKFKEYSFKDFVEEFNLGFEVNESYKQSTLLGYKIYRYFQRMIILILEENMNLNF